MDAVGLVRWTRAPAGRLAFDSWPVQGKESDPGVVRAALKWR